MNDVDLYATYYMATPLNIKFRGIYYVRQI
nr:MAG TPA: hypothetical protein [Microviridae sp.]